MTWPLGDLGVEVYVQLVDHSRDLRTDLDRRDRVDRARGLDYLSDVAFFHFRCKVLRFRLPREPERCKDSDSQDNRENPNPIPSN